MAAERVTVTLPGEIVDAIDRRAKNRSKFILGAVQQELERRKKEELMQSLKHPHPEAVEWTDEDFDDWCDEADAEDLGLLDVNRARSVEWQPGKGWVG